MAHDSPVGSLPLCQIDRALTVHSHYNAKFNFGSDKCRVCHLIWRVGLEWRILTDNRSGFWREGRSENRGSATMGHGAFTAGSSVIIPAMYESITRSYCNMYVRHLHQS
jgi:hypothetical protein